MGMKVRMVNPITGKDEEHTPQNAMDLEQHSGWKRGESFEVQDQYVGKAQQVIDRVGPKAAAAKNDEALASDETDDEPSEGDQADGDE
jgi:hypothetical protein